MTGEELEDWQAFYTLEASARNPEPTEWDDEATMAKKLARLAALKLR